MTPAESRALRPLARVAWRAQATDEGTIVGSDWSGVEINWDDGHTSYTHHNDMCDITQVRGT
jgi:hypothetical protein